ncbi:MAG: hypothetical protein ABR567_15275 [Myxococcales bacterium]
MDELKTGRREVLTIAVGTVVLQACAGAKTREQPPRRRPERV